MTIEIEEEIAVEFSFDYKETANTVIEAALDYEEFPFEAEVHLLLVNNEIIHEINLQQRQMDKPTDVLSFPMIDYPAPGEFDTLEERDDIFHPETGEAILGDIVISVDKVLTQAEEYGHSIKREFSFLIVHSMLHLMGYDHMEPKEAQEMERRQNEILNQLNITR